MCFSERVACFFLIETVKSSGILEFCVIAPDNHLMTEKDCKEIEKDKVVDISLYRIRKSLKSEGFEVVTDENGKLKLVLRLHEV